MSASAAPPRHPPDPPLAPAATVACLRDTRGGLEVLLLQRASQLAFHGGAWVFPGGRVDRQDAGDAGARYAQTAARVAAVREAHEEASLRLSPDELVPLSHWTTPPGRPRRFATWFFLGMAPVGQAVRVDGGEILAHQWLRPSAALEGQAEGRLSLPPPTFVTLIWLSDFTSAAEALARAAAGPAEEFVPRPAQVGPAVVSLYAQDAGYARVEPDLPGPRHRLSMGEGAWVYERDPDTVPVIADAKGPPRRLG